MPTLDAVSLSTLNDFIPLIAVAGLGLVYAMCNAVLGPQRFSRRSNGLGAYWLVAILTIGLPIAYAVLTGHLVGDFNSSQFENLVPRVLDSARSGA